jgi:hypothetical protein
LEVEGKRHFNALKSLFHASNLKMKKVIILKYDVFQKICPPLNPDAMLLANRIWINGIVPSILARFSILPPECESSIMISSNQQQLK